MGQIPQGDLGHAGIIPKNFWGLHRVGRYDGANAKKLKALLILGFQLFRAWQISTYGGEGESHEKISTITYNLT